MSDRQIDGTVAHVVNSRELIINRGEEHGVSTGDVFGIVNAKGKEILDPDTDEVIGHFRTIKVLVRITEVQSKASLARTFQKRSVRVVTPTDVANLTKLFAPAQYETRIERITTKEERVAADVILVVRGDHAELAQPDSDGDYATTSLEDTE